MSEEGSRYYGSVPGDFKPGDRVELHPATDLWMAGARYGTVVSTGRKNVVVDLDRLGRRKKEIRAYLLRKVQ